MDSEIAEFWKKRFKEKTFTEKIKHKLLLLKTKDSEVDKMREQLIKEAKPIFIAYLSSTRGEDNTLVIDYFDERIRSLPKESILELFSELQDLKEAKSNEARELILTHLVIHINLLYSLDGWFRKKLVGLLTNSSKKV